MNRELLRNGFFREIVSELHQQRRLNLSLRGKRWKGGFALEEGSLLARPSRFSRTLNSLSLPFQTPATQAS